MKTHCTLLFSTFLLGALNLQATTTYENTSGGNWTAGIWDLAGYPNQATDLATFGELSDTVTVNGTYTVLSLSFATNAGTGSDCTISSSGSSPELKLGGSSSNNPGIFYTLTNTQSQVINCPLHLTSNITIDINPTTTASFGTNATIGGQYAVTLSGTGTVSFAGNQNYSGTTTIGANTTFQTTTSAVLSGNSAFNVVGILDLSGNPNSISSLSGIGTIETGASVDGILTLSNGGTYTSTSTSNGIIGSGGITVQGGLLSLQNPEDVNIYSGPTTISGNGTLQAGEAYSFSKNSDYTVTGILDLNNYEIQIKSLSGSGTVTTGTNLTFPLIITDGGSFNGTMTGSIDLNLTGGTLTFSSVAGLINYNGITTLTNSGTILQATSNTNTLSQNSSFLINSNATLQNDSSNQILALGGAGNVTLASGTILTVTDGNTSSISFSGSMTGDGGFEINSSDSTTLFTISSSSGQNSYYGPTSITSGVLKTTAPFTLSVNSPVSISDTSTLNLDSNSMTIYSLSGSGAVELGSANLAITNGGDYSGAITGSLGSLNVEGLSFALSSPAGANTYTGTSSIINSATLEVLATNALSIYSAIQMEDHGTLWLNEFDAIIPSLVGTSNTSLVLDGSLDISGSATTTYQGQVSGTSSSATLTIGSAYQLTLNNTNNDYRASTQVNGDLIIDANGALSPNSAVTIAPTGELILAMETTNSALSCTNSGTLSNSGILNLTDGNYTQTAGATLDLILYPTTTSGTTANLAASSTAFLDGNLSIDGSNVTPSSGTSYLIISGYPIVDDFSSISTVGFSIEPSFFYTTTEITLYFGNCTSSWTDTNGFWGEGTNWSGSCIPGDSGNVGDIAIFGSISPATAQVTLASESGLDDFPVTLLQLHFSEDTTSYTLVPHSSASTITMDSPSSLSPQILVTSSLPQKIEAPILLNASTNLLLADGAQLTLTDGASLTSSSSDLSLMQYVGSSLGSGIFINEGQISVENLNFSSASFTNVGTALATNAVTIGEFSNLTTEITNSGQLTSTGNFTIVTDGKLSVTNSGAGALFGITGSSASFTIDAPNGEFINKGSPTIFGALNFGTDLIFRSGKFTNSQGAILKAGDFATLKIEGGQIINDQASVVGSSSADLLFTGGSIINSGLLLSNRYDQSSNTTLQLNLISSPTLIGFVEAMQTASLAGNLIVEALPGSNPMLDQTVTILTAPDGVTGKFSSAQFEGFPDDILPTVHYGEKAVFLLFSPTLSSNNYGSLTELALIGLNSFNFLVQKEIFTLHRKMQTSNAPKETLVAASNLKEPQRLIQRAQEEPTSPWRVYMGPTITTGHLDQLSISQPALAFEGFGLFGGFDYCKNKEGIGSSISYTNFSGSNFTINQVQACAYGIFLPQKDKALAIQGILGGGYDWFSTSRNAGTNVANADFGGWEIDALAGIEYTFSCFPITPIANLEYLQLQTLSFDETSAGIYDLHVKSQTQRALISLLGLRLDSLFSTKNASLRPQLDLGWQYQMLNSNTHLLVNTINIPTKKSVSSPLIAPNRNNLWVGLDFLLTLYNLFQIELSYDLIWNPSYTDNSFYLGFGGTF